jgi:hypothetical protein
MSRKPKGRREPLTCVYAPPLDGDRVKQTSKPILLLSGRGDSRLSLAEARRLREDLMQAILEAEGAAIEAIFARHRAEGTVYGGMT